MDSSKLISKTNASFPGYLDFKKLRKKGIEHCQTLSSELWTDFNLHDPGLTILEVLCYALTDLGYRTNFPIEDLLARSPQQKAKDTAEPGPDGKTFNDNFFTPEQILSCNPVTLLDLRKLLIDVPGVKNAWVERADRAEVDLYLDHSLARLQHSLPADSGSRPDTTSVTPDGLYSVSLELDDPKEVDHCLASVRKVLHRHRNLCEDFLDIVVLGEEKITLCADIEIEASANAIDVMVSIYQEIDEFLSPTIQFYSLEEMLKRGKSIEQIYEGRSLNPLMDIAGTGAGDYSHGFIDTEELERAERRTELHASDLYRLIMGVEGVLAIRNLSMINYVNDSPRTRGEKWCLELTSGYRPSFDLTRSKINFSKGLQSFFLSEVHENTVIKRYNEERQAVAKALLEAGQLDRTVPEGRYRQDLHDHRSIMHEFPAVYGIGEGELAKRAPAKRKAQAHQLRAYLLFFDQLLANYLAQLANLRELFSMRSDSDEYRLEGAKNRTYFSQLLGDVPERNTLLQDYQHTAYREIEEGVRAVCGDYSSYLDFVTESSSGYLERRNRILDHLLARFAESFTDYALLMFGMNDQRSDQERMIRDIRDKTAFLGSYPETSRDRGKGFNYQDIELVWAQNNVPGLNKRVSKLLGFGDFACEDESVAALIARDRLGQSLCHVEVKKLAAAWYWSAEFPVDRNPSLKLYGWRDYSDEEAAEEASVRFVERAKEEGSYLRLCYTRPSPEDPNKKFVQYGFAVTDDNGDLIAGFREPVDRYPWSSSELRDNYLFRLVDMAIQGTLNEKLSMSLEAPAYRCQLNGGDGRCLLKGSDKRPDPNKPEQTWETAEDDAWQEAEALLKLARDPVNFGHVDTLYQAGYGLELIDQEGRVQATHPGLYRTEKTRQTQIQAAVCLANAEGFHMLENLLLRPREFDGEDFALLPIACDVSDLVDGLDSGVEAYKIDPFSFRATVVIPYWPDRFRDLEFRRFVERTLRMEAPAHVFLRICWVNPKQLYHFEQVYQKWLCVQARSIRGSERTTAHNAVVKVLGELRNVYNTVRLSGENVSIDTQTMILDQAKLGSGGEDHE